MRGRPPTIALISSLVLLAGGPGLGLATAAKGGKGGGQHAKDKGNHGGKPNGRPPTAGDNRVLPPPPEPPPIAQPPFPPPVTPSPARCEIGEACLWNGDDPGGRPPMVEIPGDDYAASLGWSQLRPGARNRASSAANNFRNRVIRFATRAKGYGARICLRPGQQHRPLPRAFYDSIVSWKVSGLGASCPRGE